MKNYLVIILILFTTQVFAEPAVYKVERLIWQLADTYNEDLLAPEPPLVQIEIGASEHDGKRVPLPPREAFEPMLLVGTEGVTARAGLYEFEKRCAFLCGDESEECHDTAIVGWPGENIGTPLLVLTGIEGEATEFISYRSTQPAEDIPQLAIHNQALIWPPENFLGIEIKGKDAVFNYGYEPLPSTRYPQPAPDCRWYDYADTGLARLACDSAEALLFDQRPILYSAADYNISNVQVLNRFTLNGQHYYTVMLALKAYTAFGLLTQKNDQWIFLVRPANWAQLC